MTLARALIAEIPVLRRFSRALFGDVARADACLETILTNILSGTDSRFTSVPNGHVVDLRLKLLGSLVDALPARLDDFDPSCRCAMEKSAQTILRRIPKRPLLAFLLRTLEGLDDEDIAYVMGISPLQARLLVELGNASIAGEISTKVLIIDSDPAAGDLIGALIQELGHSLCGIAKTADEARDFIEREQPGLIISELVLSDQSVDITLFGSIPKFKDVPLIIITRFPEMWNESQGIYPAGIITKPFLKNVVRATISKALFFNRRSKVPYWDYQKEIQISH